MEKNKEQEIKNIVIDDVEYPVDKLTDKQKLTVDAITKLDVQINKLKFEIDQSFITKEALINALKSSLEE